MTRQEVADYFGVGVMTVYGWGRSGQLTEYKHGKRFVRYRRDDVEQFLQPTSGVAPEEQD